MGHSQQHGVLSAVRRASERTPDRAAVLSGGSALSYGGLSEQVRLLARALSEDGVQPGDRVALILDNSVEFIVAYLATLGAGAVSVPLNPRAPLANLRKVFQDCRPAAAFLRSSLLESLNGISAFAPELTRAYCSDVVSGAVPRGVTASAITARIAAVSAAGEFAIPDEHALALITYTSGTTGAPKGVMLSHANMAAIVDAGQSLVQLREGDRIGAVVPLFHLYGHREVDLVLCAGAALVVPAERNFAAAMLAEMHHAAVTGLCSVPSALGILLERNRREVATCLGDLRYLAIGTAPLPSRTLTALRETLPHTRLFTTYGLTEASRVCWVDITDPASPADPRVVGQPYPGVNIRLIDERGGIGRVTLTGPSVMMGYWENSPATAEVLTGDGTLLTPDCGRIDENGMLHLLGRRDDVINCGGEKVSPVEIEEVLAGHPMIAEVTVLGIADPDGLLGEVVQAVVVVKDEGSLAATDIQAFAASLLEPHKVPRYVEFVQEIPLSVLGKARRSALRVGDSSRWANGAP